MFDDVIECDLGPLIKTPCSPMMTPYIKFPPRWNPNNYRRSQGGLGGPPPHPNWDATNDRYVTKKTIVSSVSVSFGIFAYNSKCVEQ